MYRGIKQSVLWIRNLDLIFFAERVVKNDLANLWGKTL